MQPDNRFEPGADAREHLEKALNFQRMGMMSAAEHEMNLARQLDPSIAADPRFQAFNEQKTAQQSQAEAMKLPMRVGAGMLIADILVTMAVTLITLVSGNLGFLAWGVIRVGINLYLAITLLQLKDTARRATIWWAILGLIIGTLSALAAYSWIDVGMQVSFSGALLILLPGKPSKARVVLAACLFILGYFGSFCGGFAFAFLNAMG